MSKKRHRNCSWTHPVGKQTKFKQLQRFLFDDCLIWYHLKNLFLRESNICGSCFRLESVLIDTKYVILFVCNSTIKPRLLGSWVDKTFRVWKAYFQNFTLFNIRNKLKTKTKASEGDRCIVLVLWLWLRLFCFLCLRSFQVFRFIEDVLVATLSGHFLRRTTFLKNRALSLPTFRKSMVACLLPSE